MGWKRALLYWRHRVFRTGDSTNRITTGLAIGAAVSFSPFLGTHVAQALFFTWLLRGNLVAAFLGTGVGLPPCLPFIFLVSYRVGIRILGVFGFSERFALPPGGMTWELMLHEPVKLLAPLTVGGYLCGAVAGIIVYAAFYYPVRMARIFYRAQRLHRYHKQHEARKGGAS
jgi:uncharacterized protein (DUF2062 family)